MSYNVVKLMDITAVPTSVGSLLACPGSGTKTIIGGLYLHNTDASSRDVTLYDVPDNSSSLGTPAAANQFFKQSLAANETLFIEFKPPIILTDTNDAIFGLASGSGVNIKLSGGTITP